MYRKINMLRRNRETMTESDFLIQLNKWDKEVVELMAAAEKRCRKIKTNHIDWSPVVGYYKKHIQLYKWIAHYKDGKKTNVGNLIRACGRNGLMHPDRYSKREAELGVLGTVAQLEELAASAPTLQQGHLHK